MQLGFKSSWLWNINNFWTSVIFYACLLKVVKQYWTSENKRLCQVCISYQKIKSSFYLVGMSSGHIHVIAARVIIFFPDFHIVMKCMRIFLQLKKLTWIIKIVRCDPLSSHISLIEIFLILLKQCNINLMSSP